MNVQWCVIKYIPDTFRFEPQNMGVVVFGEGGETLLRFYAESDGKVDGRRLRGLKLDADNYRGWIKYFRRKADAGRWEDVRQAMRRRPDFPFYIDHGGSVPDADAPGQALSELFRDLVEDDEGADQDLVGVRSEPLTARIGRILAMSNISIRRNLTVPARFSSGAPSRRNVETEVTFSYGHENGHLHLMDPVAQPSNAYAFFARAEAAHRVNSQLRFLAFYRSSVFEGHENDLEVVESYADAVDVDEIDVAASVDQLQEAVGVKTS